MADNLQSSCGETGSAHSLVLLVHALEQAKPGEKILVAGFGQGCDVLLFEATEAIKTAGDRRALSVDILLTVDQRTDTHAIFHSTTC
ncbi:MAG: hypothetical protein Ct9H300mP14_09170 [Gammaproteobacteria bacterium]|nr:MAG: hypothetical protein Ct9H300mP14_09170 [Gammaproteobacteria bacterium]